MPEEDEAGKETKEEENPAVPKRVRRFSVFLILGVVALLALGTWFVTSWFGTSYYGNDNPDLASPPAVENRSPDSAQ